jgi:hypothetical protein
MLFPGRKALMENIPTRNIQVDDLVSEFTKQNFSGYAEFLFDEGRGIVLFHSGEVVTAIFKKHDTVKGQDDAITAIKNTSRLEEGKVNSYQLPSEMAHMLRGLCNRKFLEEIHVSGKLKLILDKLEQNNETGTLDVLFTDRKEKGMILFINGRISNSFLEMDRNLTLEGKDALDRIYQLTDETDGSCKIFQSEFSQEIWKSRRGTGKPHESRMYQILTRKEDDEPSPLQEVLKQFLARVGNPPFSAIIGNDGALLAQASAERGNGGPEGDFYPIIEEAVALFSAIDMGEMKEILCTSSEKNLLIRAIPQNECFHILVLERRKPQKDLRKQLGALDKEIVELLSPAAS